MDGGIVGERAENLENETVARGDARGSRDRSARFRRKQAAIRTAAAIATTQDDLAWIFNSRDLSYPVARRGDGISQLINQRRGRKVYGPGRAKEREEEEDEEEDGEEEEEEEKEKAKEGGVEERE